MTTWVVPRNILIRPLITFVVKGFFNVFRDKQEQHGCDYETINLRQHIYCFIIADILDA